MKTETEFLAESVDLMNEIKRANEAMEELKKRATDLVQEVTDHFTKTVGVKIGSFYFRTLTPSDRFVVLKLTPAETNETETEPRRLVLEVTMTKLGKGGRPSRLWKNIRKVTYSFDGDQIGDNPGTYTLIKGE